MSDSSTAPVVHVELLPCPSCDGTLFTWLGNDVRSLQWPHCSGCGMAGPAGDTRDQAGELWNILPRAKSGLLAILVEAVHDRLFGVASLDDPLLALREIKDDGGIHEAVHELIRALPPTHRLTIRSPMQANIERLEAINAELGLELSNAIILLKAAGVDETPNGTIARARATIAKALEGEAGNGAS